jgi:hypothetical protein
LGYYRPLVLSLVNKTISSKRFPSSMKEALLTFIPKDGDPLLLTNYRGIALLSSLYKVVTGVLNYRLTQLLRDHGGMEINQGGNKKGVNAAHKAAVLINVITDARMQRKPLHIIYTDMKKAFPSTPYEAFHDALRVLGMNPDFMKLIVDTQTDFVTTAKGPSGLATPRKKLVGVHEGDCLSPTLFCLAMNMYSKWMNALPLGYNMEPPNNSSLQSLRIATNAYMDDMALLGKTASECQSLLSYFERFLCFYGMSLNSTKCAYQYKENDVTWKPVQPLTKWGLVPIYGPKSSYKYLGYFINITLDFSTQLWTFQPNTKKWLNA